MLNLDGLKSFFGGSKLSNADYEQLSQIIISMDNDKLFGAYEILRPKDNTKLSEFDEKLLNLIMETLKNRGFTFDCYGNIGVN